MRHVELPRSRSRGITRTGGMVYNRVPWNRLADRLPLDRHPLRQLRHVYTGGPSVADAGLGFWAALLPIATTLISTAGSVALKKYESRSAVAASNASTSNDALLANLAARQAETQLQQNRLELQREQIAAQTRQTQTTAQATAANAWILPTVAIGGGVAVLALFMGRRRRR